MLCYNVYCILIHTIRLIDIIQSCYLNADTCILLRYSTKCQTNPTRDHLNLGSKHEFTFTSKSKYGVLPREFTVVLLLTTFYSILLFAITNSISL